MSVIGYYNYYNNPRRYSPDKPMDCWQQMVDRAEGDELHANNEDPYAAENLARRKLDERLADYAAAVRSQCKSQDEVRQYLNRKYFGRDEIGYTKRWEEAETYAMLENDYNAICYGTIGGGNYRDPRLGDDHGKQTFAQSEAAKRAASQRIISNQFANLLARNGVGLANNDAINISIDPYNYGVSVSGDGAANQADKIAALLGRSQNAKNLLLWSLYDNDKFSAAALTKWRAFQNVREYTGLDLSALTLKEGNFYTSDGQNLLDLLKDGIRNFSLNPQFKGVAFDYVSSMVNEVAAKGWDNMEDMRVNLAYFRDYGFYRKS